MTENGENPDMAGAVDLASPVVKCINEFKSQMVQGHASAVVLVGVTDGGNVVLSRLAPGGDVQFLGLLELAKTMQRKAEQPRR